MLHKTTNLSLATDQGDNEESSGYILQQGDTDATDNIQVPHRSKPRHTINRDLSTLSVETTVCCHSTHRYPVNQDLSTPSHDTSVAYS